ncbi:hypothetical protein D3C71_906660 [compost metagenome]
MFERRLCRQKDAAHIDVQLPLDLFERLCGKITSEQDAGIVNQDVEAAEFCDSPVDSGGRGIGPGRVGLDGNRFAT